MVATRSQGVFQSELAKPAPLAAGVAAPAGPGGGRTGVVFVHGIGSQQPAETLLQWSAPLIEVLTAWHRHRAAAPGDTSPADPVLRAAIDFSSSFPTIALGIPATTAPDGTVHPAREWLLTEAWWASKVTPPSLATIANWLGPRGGAGQIVDGILGNRSEGRLLTLARGALVPFVSVLSGIILTVYGLVRGVTGIIPIQAVKDAAILREFDNFLTGWFGDVRILLFDPAQSANIRDGLAEAVTRLHDAGCDRIVVVAHSGGAMVSFLALADPAIDPDLVRVDKLVTFGSGWNLALRLTPEGVGMADRLRRDITRRRPDLRWRDFWGSHDPAPAGKLQLDQIRPPIVDASHVRSYRVWNRRSLVDDHGGYFDNDEEFVVPLLREIDVADGWGETSRFYPPDPGVGEPPIVGEGPIVDPDEDPIGIVDPRVIRHRQRVATIALWRQAALAIPVATIALALQLYPTRLITIGNEVAALLPRVVGAADLIDLVRTFSTTTLDAVTFSLPFLGQVPPGVIADASAVLGTGVLQGIVFISAMQLAAAPVQAFLAWPRRAAIRGWILAVETILIVGMAVAVVGPLALATDHATLLGAGFAAWIPGIGVTLGTGVLAWVGTMVARRIRAPAASGAFGAVASIVFTVALASSVVVIFRTPDLEQVELAYIAVWVGAYVVLNVGRGRWSVWDHAERQVAYGLTADVPVDRRPVLAAAAGFLVVGLVLAAWVLVGASTWVVAGIVAAIVLILIGMALGARAWRRYGDPTGTPGAVESARGST